jgi:replicative DNA helicase
VRPAFFKMSEMIMDTVKTVERLFERKELVTGVATGFLDLDRMTAGLQPADLIIVAARPSMGKTAFVLNIAQYVALHANTAVGLFSLEMSKEQLVMRMLCSEARVDNAKVRTGYLGERDFPRLAMAAGRLAEAPIFIDDTPAQNVLELRAKARRLKREANVGLIVIDYLQLMRGLTAQENRTQELSEISRSLKSLAKELGVPVIALSQLNRQVEQRADKRPMMSDIRESGSIEQDADVIMFIYRDEVYKADSQDEGVAEVVVGKQRNGPTGTVRLAFRREYTRFDNLVEAMGEPNEPTPEEG